MIEGIGVRTICDVDGAILAEGGCIDEQTDIEEPSDGAIRSQAIEIGMIDEVDIPRIINR